jgi:hypothetical protein
MENKIEAIQWNKSHISFKMIVEHDTILGSKFELRWTIRTRIQCKRQKYKTIQIIKCKDD